METEKTEFAIRKSTMLTKCSVRGGREKFPLALTVFTYLHRISIFQLFLGVNLYLVCSRGGSLRDLFQGRPLLIQGD